MNRFLILSSARTGSNMLVSALKHHPNCVCFNELFGPSIHWGYSKADDWGERDDLTPLMRDEALFALRSSNPERFIGRVYENVYEDRVLATGFKLFYYHDRNIENGLEMWKALSSDPKLKIIWLRRKDMIASYYSLKTAETTGQWIYDKLNEYDVSAIRPIQIYIPDFLVSTGRLLQVEEDRVGLFNKHEIHSVWYEDLVGDWKTTIWGIFDFLGLPQLNIGATTYQQNRHPLRDTIINYQEVRDALIAANLAERVGG